MRRSFCTFISAFSISVAAQSPSPSNPTSPAAPQSTVCGDIVNSGSFEFPAKQAFDCLTSVPFNADVASRFIEYYNESIQFQSTLAYLKHPPSSYQQPAVDLIAGLDQIQSEIKDGKFPNQYAFEVSLQNLIYSAHDAHLNLFAGILSVFTFAAPYSIVSVSLDGAQLPQVYIADDIFESQYDGGDFPPSPITSINGQDVVSYLSQLAASNAQGSLEPHADWNQLMASSTLYAEEALAIFEGDITFYPGENITVVLQNGTTLGPDQFTATYNSQGDTGPLATGGDFYNFFVLGLLPASYDNSSDTENATATATASTTSGTASSTTAPSPSSWADIGGAFAYPINPIVAQKDLGNSGFATGYLIPESSLAVLSIPAFLSNDSTGQEFSQLVSDFIRQTTQAGASKVLIDLQQNYGGVTFLAIDTFKQFFPTIDPFLGSRLRAHDKANVLGETFTQYFNSQDINETYYDIFSASDWVATDRLNAETGQNFTSWEEFFGPHQFNGDLFTTTQRPDLSDALFVSEASGGLDLYGSSDRPAAPNPPFSAENIVILSDGLCSSTCALLMEMMHHEAGVRTVVVGGRPTYGPMQAPSGSRGAEEYSFGFPAGDYGDLDADLEVVRELNASTVGPLTFAIDDDYETYASLNLRDQIRKGDDSDTPVQFLYEAANCRIFYTPQTIFNYTALWTYAAAAVFSNANLCVQGSTGYASSGPNPANLMVPTPPADPSLKGVSYGVDGIVALSGDAGALNIPASFSGQELDVVVPKVVLSEFNIEQLAPALRNQNQPVTKGNRAGRLNPPARVNNQGLRGNTNANNGGNQKKNPPSSSRLRRRVKKRGGWGGRRGRSRV